VNAGVTHRQRRLCVAAAATAVTLLGLSALPAAADPTLECTFPGKNFGGRPWSLKRVPLDELWAQSTGRGVRVAVIDTGVDIENPQLSAAVDVKSGRNLLPRDLRDEYGGTLKRGNENGTADTVGHGTKVAGIIAARPARGTGFVGLAPDATVIPIQQNDAEGHGTAETLAGAIRYAVEAGADVINISQDTADAVRPAPVLKHALDDALAEDIVVVASAGNDGLAGRAQQTFPAAYDGVLAVAASGRDNERAAFSQPGDFVGVAAPGVDMISTVPGGGHCADSGTSFSAPYVAGVAALIRSKHEDWTAAQIVGRIQQTAERSIAGRDRLVGWGVVDPVRALTEDSEPVGQPAATGAAAKAGAPDPAGLRLGETPQERDVRLAAYVVVGGGVLIATIVAAAVVLRDARRRAGRTADR
jgi:type VII secretion-associated serine protease mycosin